MVNCKELCKDNILIFFFFFLKLYNSIDLESNRPRLEFHFDIYCWGGASDKQPTCQSRRQKETWIQSLGHDWRKVWQPTPVFFPGKSPWTEEPHSPLVAKSRTQLKQLSTYALIVMWAEKNHKLIWAAIFFTCKTGIINLTTVFIRINKIILNLRVISKYAIFINSNIFIHLKNPWE